MTHSSTLALLREASGFLLNLALRTVQTEFGKLGEVIEKVQKKIQEAGLAKVRGLSTRVSKGVTH